MKPGFYTAALFGRDHNKLKISSVRFIDRPDAENWAEFLNIKDPKHFVIHVPAELKE